MFKLFIHYLFHTNTLLFRKPWVHIIPALLTLNLKYAIHRLQKKQHGSSTILASTRRQMLDFQKNLSDLQL